MLDEYRIEPLSIGQYLDSVESEDTKIDQAVQRSFCWSKEMMNSLIYSALSRKIYIPNLILAEEKKNGIKQTYVVDGGQRTETLLQFKFYGYKITNNLRSYMIPYKKKLVNQNGEIIRDEYGNIKYEIEEFDIRNKKYEDLPQELKNKFDGCPLTTVVYQDCTPEETSELVLLYNNHVAMNVSQKSLTYVGKFAEEIKKIKEHNRFLKDCTVLTENERQKGVWERVISESVMVINHFDNWKKNAKDMCDYLNNNSSMQEYKKVEEYFNRLIPYSDKLENEKIAALFSSKNLFIWLKVFDLFTKYNLQDNKFGEFLLSFVNDLKNKKINNENWEDIDINRSTKDKGVINKKINYLLALLEEFMKKEFTEINLVEFIAKNLDMEINEIESDLDFYEESLEKLETDNIKDGSKLLEKKNHPSLLAMIVYSYKEDKDLDEWIKHYAKFNESYNLDQQKNFLHMKQDFDQYCIGNKMSA